MANTAQARKRARQSVSRRERNMALRSKLRTFVKNVVKAIDLKDKLLFSILSSVLLLSESFWEFLTLSMILSMI